MSKSTKELVWYNHNGKVILIINDDWKATSLIACPVDLIIISKEAMDKFRSKILPNVLRKARIIYL